MALYLVVVVPGLFEDEIPSLLCVYSYLPYLMHESMDGYYSDSNIERHSSTSSMGSLSNISNMSASQGGTIRRSGGTLGKSKSGWRLSSLSFSRGSHKSPLPDPTKEDSVCLIDLIRHLLHE